MTDRLRKGWRPFRPARFVGSLPDTRVGTSHFVEDATSSSLGRTVNFLEGRKNLEVVHVPADARIANIVHRMEIFALRGERYNQGEVSALGDVFIFDDKWTLGMGVRRAVEQMRNSLFTYREIFDDSGRYITHIVVTGEDHPDFKSNGNTIPTVTFVLDRPESTETKELQPIREMILEESPREEGKEIS